MVISHLFAQTPELDNPEYDVAPSDGGVLKGCQSVTLKSGFRFKAEDGKTLRIMSDTSICSPNVLLSTSIGGGESANGVNYIVRLTPLDATSKANFGDGTIDHDRGTRVYIEAKYFDGLGRLSQTVLQGITPLGADLVTLQEYDTQGRQSSVWLPVPVSGKGAFCEITGLKGNASGFYADSRPFAQPVYENSPLNRAIEQKGPGMAWDTHPVRMGYGTNSDTNPELICRNYVLVNPTSAILKGNYPAGELFVTNRFDEDNNPTLEFRDKLDRLVLTRQLTGSEQLDTYFIYDNFGNRCFVLPPLAADEFKIANRTKHFSMIGLYAYYYRYDERNRRVEAKPPGCSSTYYIYDRADRLILSQNGNQRARNEWNFFKYDPLGREALGGTTTLTQGEAETLRSQYATEVLVVTRAQGADYEDNHPLGTNPIFYTVNYYDDYSFLNNEDSVNGLSYVAEPDYGQMHTNNRGLLTGTRVCDLTDPNREVVTAYYYDTSGRKIQTRQTNLLGGTDISFVAYDFSGKNVREKSVHAAPDFGVAVTERYRYEYDHAGRQTATFYQLNDLAEKQLSRHKYNELGQLERKFLQNGDTVGYVYNIRGWTRAINTRSFSQTLFYQDAPSGATSRYNGNISAYNWRNNGEAENTYYFSYDGLNRMKKGTYNGKMAPMNAFDEELGYDKHGNILSLKRRGKNETTGVTGYGLMDDVTMTYNGNQMTQACDNVFLNAGNGMDFIPGTTNITHDLNGNMTQAHNNYGSADCPIAGYTVQYNRINLPASVQTHDFDQNTTLYYYTSDGIKYRVVHSTALTPLHTPLRSAVSERVSNQLYDTLTIDYARNKIYHNGQLKMVTNPEGYVAPDENGTWQYYQYIHDHQGNVRVVLRGKTTMEINDYYPFGMEYGVRTNNHRQPFKYNGKEIQLMHGLNMYDYAARFYAFTFGRFPQPDPLADKYYAVSPYAYCLNNPMRFVDPDGKKPTPVEAARIAAHVYGDKKDNFLTGGWQVSKQNFNVPLVHKNGLKSNMYERVVEDKVTEYVYAYAGTEDATDVREDALQLVGASSQYSTAADNADNISRNLGQTELTFVGHSLGGGLAALSAMMTNRSAMTFNPAGLSIMTMLRHLKFKKGIKENKKINAYILRNDFLNLAQDLIRKAPKANGRRFYIDPDDWNFMNGHSIDNMVTSLSIINIDLGW